MCCCHRVAPHKEMTSVLRLSLFETMVTHSLDFFCRHMCLWTQAALPSSYQSYHNDKCNVSHIILSEEIITITASRNFNA